MKRRISISVIPRSSKEKVNWLSKNEAKVWVHAAPDKGKANKSVCEIIAKSLGLSRTSITIIKGATSAKKIIEISE